MSECRRVRLPQLHVVLQMPFIPIGYAHGLWLLCPPFVQLTRHWRLWATFRGRL